MSSKFSVIESHVVPLAADNVDTDQIIPARFLKITDKNGLGEKLFNDWRYDGAGKPNPAFVLNEPASKGAEVLLAGVNFGCGSSREHAPWALRAWGLRAVIATSFADIFKGNSLKNGLLPVVVDAATSKELFEVTAKDRAAKVRVDLETETLTLPSGRAVKFSVDSFSKHCLLAGVDELGYLLGFEAQIQKYEQGRKQFA
jgi:3-isopropylmalate/(R)-2-methylmalate dehydratase small subunit